MKAKLFIMTLFICNWIFAQKDSLRKHTDFMLWANCGTGIGAAGKYHSDFVFNSGISAGFRGKYFIFFRHESIEPIGFNKSAVSESNKENEVLDLYNYSLLFGIGSKNFKIFHPVFSIGPSCGNGIFRGEITDVVHYSGWWGSNNVPVYAMDTFRYVGFKMDLALLWAWRFVGMSLEFYVNFHKYSDCGATLNFNLGLLGENKRKGTLLPQQN